MASEGNAVCSHSMSTALFVARLTAQCGSAGFWWVVARARARAKAPDGQYFALVVLVLADPCEASGGWSATLAARWEGQYSHLLEGISQGFSMLLLTDAYIPLSPELDWDFFFEYLCPTSAVLAIMVIVV